MTAPKYEGKVLEDGFVTASLNALSREANEKGFFLMVKTTRTLDEVPAFASMWRMEGLILMGFCEADYAALRQAIRTPIVVYDGYMQGCPGVVNLVIDHADGGRQARQYLKAAGHTRRSAWQTTISAWTRSEWTALQRPLAPTV